MEKLHNEELPQILGYKGDRIKNGGMGRTRKSERRDKNYAILVAITEEKTHFGYVGVDGRIILKWA
jgi:hypothetical protein